MPYISVQLSNQISQAQHNNLAAGITNIMQEVLNKRAELTAVNINQSPPNSWFINKQNLESSCEQSAFVTAKISANTNSEAEKAAAVEEIYHLLDQEVGPIHPTSYISLDETPMTDWGYGGKTQQHRAIKRTASGNIDTNYYLEKGKAQRSETAFRLFRKLKKAFKLA